MVIGISAYLLHQGRDYRAAGVSAYIGHLLAHLPRVAPEHTFVAFHGRDSGVPPGVRSAMTPAPTRFPLVRIPWEQVGLPVELRRARVDLVHGTVNVLPLTGRTPAAVTVHDLSFLRHPERFPRAKVLYLRQMVERSIRRADRVIAVSRHTRGDLVELCNLPAERISVIYSGVDPSFRPFGEGELAPFRRRAFGGRPFILHVGTLEPRKNLDVLIRAFAAVRDDLHPPHLLALVGARGWMYEDLYRLVERLRLRDHVSFVDYVPAAELPLWYNCADLFAYPSAYEGFGLPVLEAMACGLPTVTSASSGLQELAGGACLTVQPGSQEALQVALARVLADEEVRDSLRRAGLERAKQFTWEETARATVGVYSRIMEGTAG
ncbi:MAG: glycosyltransferase family 4 protein [Chloroflexi bacterium]|nr:glycosyltransferase family 4 protein [Chloroflexota bacterium]